MAVSVSVIIPTHNRVNSLSNAIRSVLNQTYQDFEIIIVNDASSDETIEMVAKLQTQDKRIHLINNPKPLGGAEARNLGIQASKGTWVAFLDDDDEWLPQKLAKQMQALAHRPKAIASSCSYTINYPFGIKKIIHTPQNITLQEILRSNSLGGASVCIVNAATIKIIGYFDKKLRSSQDWDLWVRLCEQGNIISVNVPLVSYQVHFNYRISNDMRAKYTGARRFYFKHKSKMNREARNANLSFICFIQSRQNFRSLTTRWKRLLMAIKYSSRKTGFSYFISSVPRLL